jgi:hypothetical protein
MDWKQKRIEWEAKWPHHCTKCGGWGGSSYVEMHGFKYGPGETIFEPCQEFEDLTICHRCGEHGLKEDGEGPCRACGWNYDDGIPEPEPDYPDEGDADD